MRKGKIRGLYDTVSKWKVLIIIFIVFSFFVFAYFSQSIEMDSSAKVDSVLQEHDQYLVKYKEFERIFGANNYIIIALESGDVFTNDMIDFIKVLSNNVKELEGVKDVYSLSTMYDIKSNNGNDFVVEKFIDERVQYSDEELNSMKNIYTRHPVLAGRLLGIKGKAALLQVQLMDNLEEKEQDLLVKKIKDNTSRLISSKNITVTPYYAGDAVVSTAIIEAQEKEGFLYPMMLTVLFIILLLFFRKIPGVVLPLSVVIITMTIILGLKSITGSDLSTIDPLLYALITSIAVGDSVHIISAWYNRGFNISTDNKEKIINIMTELFVPCFLTTITTAVGFGSIAISQIPQIRQFGIFAAAGVILAFFLTIIFIPAALIAFGQVKKMEGIQQKEKGTFKIRFKDIQSYLSDKISLINYKYARVILIIFAILLVFTIIGIRQIETGTNMYSLLKDNTSINKSLHFIEDNISGISDLEILLEADINDLFKEPEVLKEVEGLQNYVEGLDGVTTSNSYITLIKMINKAMHNNDDKYYTIPSSRRLIAQYIFLYEMSEDRDYLNRWVNDSFDKMRINFKTSNSAKLDILESEIQSFYKNHDFRNVEIGITGSTVLMERTDDLFISSQIRSLLLALIIISIIMMILFRSLKLGIFSIIVNLVPILCGLGLMGFLNIKLDMGTAMIAPIAIGVAVDDTIHFLTQYKKKYTDDTSIKNIFSKIYSIILKPIIFTSVVLAVGFGSNIISNFKPNAYFGVITAFTLIVAMICDLFLLPSLIVVFQNNGLKIKKPFQKPKEIN